MFFFRSDETQDNRRHTVQVAALECSEGTVQWMYPRGQIHLSVRPKPSIFTHHYSSSTPGDKSLSNLLASRSSAPNELLSSFDRNEDENSGRQPKMTLQEQNSNQNANSEYEHGKSFDAVRVCLRVRNSPSSSRHPALQDDVAIVLSNGRKMSPVRVREAARKRELICETLVVNLDLNPAVYTFRIQHHNLGAGMKTECTSCQTSNVHSNSNESSVILDYFVKWI